MKKLTILLVIIFTFLFSTTSLGEWKFGSENVDGDKFYYDKDRVKKSGKFIYFWELIDLLKPDKWGDLSSTTYVQLDCSIFRFKALKYQFYKNSMGEGEMDDYTPPYEWEYPKPNSTDESVCNFVCKEHQ